MTPHSPIVPLGCRGPWHWLHLEKPHHPLKGEGGCEWGWVAGSNAPVNSGIGVGVAPHGCWCTGVLCKMEERHVHIHIHTYSLMDLC